MMSEYFHWLITGLRPDGSHADVVKLWIARYLVFIQLPTLLILLGFEIKLLRDLFRKS